MLRVGGQWLRCGRSTPARGPARGGDDRRESYDSRCRRCARCRLHAAQAARSQRSAGSAPRDVVARGGSRHRPRGSSTHQPGLARHHWAALHDAHQPGSVRVLACAIWRPRQGPLSRPVCVVEMPSGEGSSLAELTQHKNRVQKFYGYPGTAVFILYLGMRSSTARYHDNLGR